MANIYLTLYTMDLGGFQMLTFTLHNSIITLFMEGDFEESKVTAQVTQILNGTAGNQGQAV